jgi:cyclic pyranopterin phosphate synthase
MSVLDAVARPLHSLRLSVTDRCNLRCQYCMPEPDYVWLPRADLLTFEEMDRLVDQFLALGVDRVRLTGGEPLLRRDLPRLVERLARKPGLADLALTTNGVRLAPLAQSLRDAGLHRITVSLDTLRPDRFTTLTRSSDFAAVLDGIDAARLLFGGLKIDTVVLAGTNDDELVDLVRFGVQMNAEVRFIEYMDVGGATQWTPAGVVSRAEILERLAGALGPVTPAEAPSSAPARRYRLANGAIVGIIASTTEPFCADCDRVRVTADGQMLTCLYATAGVDLRAPLRDGSSDEAVRARIAERWRRRQDRGAEVRAQTPARGAFVAVADLRRNAHLEMHTRGG